jgi:hypothetical protein
MKVFTNIVLLLFCCKSRYFWNSEDAHLTDSSASFPEYILEYFIKTFFTAIKNIRVSAIEAIRYKNSTEKYLVFGFHPKIHFFTTNENPLENLLWQNTLE